MKVPAIHTRLWGHQVRGHLRGRGEGGLVRLLHVWGHHCRLLENQERVTINREVRGANVQMSRLKSITGGGDHCLISGMTNRPVAIGGAAVSEGARW